MPLQQLMLRPSQIRFTQDSISDDFGRGTGETLEQTFKELLYGETSPHDIRPLGVVLYENRYWVVSGNRRLYVYRKLEELGRISELIVNKKPINMDRFLAMKTTKDNGASVRVRGGGLSLEHRFNVIVAEWKRKGRPTSGFSAYSSIRVPDYRPSPSSRPAATSSFRENTYRRENTYPTLNYVPPEPRRVVTPPPPRAQEQRRDDSWCIIL